MRAYHNTRPEEKEKENRTIVHTLKNLHTKVWYFIRNQTQYTEYTIKLYKIFPIMFFFYGSFE